MAKLSYVHLTSGELSDISTIHGQIIKVSDDMYVYDTANGIRTAIDAVTKHINLESLLITNKWLFLPYDTIIISEESDSTVKFYVRDDSKENKVREVFDSYEVLDISGDVELVVPSHIRVNGNKTHPETSITQVFADDGRTLEDILETVFKGLRTGMCVKQVLAVEENQRAFEIPFPFSDYLESGNSFIVMIGMLWVDPTRYNVVDNKLVFALDDGVAMGRKVSFLFIYNTYNNFFDETRQIVDGSAIIDGSITADKLEDSAKSILYNQFIKDTVTIDETQYTLNTTYSDPNTINIGGNKIVISLHLLVSNPDTIYTTATKIATLPIDLLPKISIENTLLVTDKGPIDVSILSNGDIVLSGVLRPDSPSRIDGTIQYII